MTDKNKNDDVGIVDAIRDIALALYVALGLIGYLIAVFYWDHPPQGFVIIAGIAGWVALVWVVAFVVSLFQDGRELRARRRSS